MEDQTNPAVSTKKASKKAILKCFLNWLFFAHGTYNYERLQGIGFLHAMSPVIDDLYEKDDLETRKEAMLRHTAFFNTEPRLGSMIVGLCAAMEERIASGEKELSGAMGSIKYGLMGPISGIGDTLMQAILSPLLLSMALGLALNGNVAGPILYCLVFIGIVIVLGYYCFMMGYRKGDEAIVSFIESGIISKVINGAGIMGCVIMGALVANFVSLTTKVKFEITTGAFDLQQGFFDAIMPKILPLILTLIVYKLLKNPKSSPLKVMGIIIVAGIILGAIGLI
ncbi:MAG: PTS system mannose/fructose/sorbose family transporter subunit IID [Treponema sp.]|jgi:PTS system mannose-specific IID component|nr:PTS system mannose/fructose/sorbose family transporter subunit IID [Treponema sp.]